MRTINVMVCLLAASLLPTSVTWAQQQPTVRWEPTLEAAQRVAAQTNRLVLIHFSAPWCEHCKWMEAQVFPQPPVIAALAADYVPVKINADNFPSTAKKYGVARLPTTVIALPDGRPIETVPNRMDAVQYVALLSRVAANTKQHQTAMYAQVPGGPAAPPSLATSQPLGQPPLAVADNRYANPPRTEQPALPAPISQPPVASTQPTNPVVVPIGQPPVTAQPPLLGQMNQRPVNQPPANQPPIGGQPSGYGQAAVGSAQPVGQPAISVPAAPPYGAPSAPALPQPPRDANIAPVAPNGGNPVSAVQPMAPLVSPSQGVGGPVSPAAPAMNPPLGLDGYCPVSLCEQQKWVPGDRRWGVVHRGRTYLFAGPEQQRRFFVDPDRYAPVISGNDVVLAVEQGQAVPGSRKYGVVFANRVYLFSSEASLQRFAKNSKAYASQTVETLRSGTR
ncbi:MAG: thioredoxin family protein [Planctomycetaceae bacterium]|nr:thioredoxin family protein [Planctomycetaceae bacterium]